MPTSSSSDSGEEDEEEEEGGDAYGMGGYPVVRPSDPHAGGRYVGPWMLGWGPFPAGWIAYDNRESIKVGRKRKEKPCKKSSVSTSKKRNSHESRNREDKQMEKKVKTLHSRCSLKSLKSLLGVLDINDSQKELLNATPFGSFFEDLPDIVMEIGMLDVLVGVWDSDGNAFKIAGASVPFGIEDVVSITGLRNSGERVEFSCAQQSKSPMHAKLFPKEKLLRKTIAEKIRSAVSDGKDDEALAKLLILYLFNCLLFSPSNYKLNDRFSHYVSDLRTLDTWNWAEAIYRYLVSQLNYVNGNMGNRDAGDEEQNVGYLGGFALLILVWFWEHTKLKEPINPDKFPRMKRWKHESYRSRVEFLKVFDNLKRDEVVAHLILSEQEKELVCPETDFRSVGAKQGICLSLCEGKYIDEPTEMIPEETTGALANESMGSTSRIADLFSVVEKLECHGDVAQATEVFKENYSGALRGLMRRVVRLERRVDDLEMDNKELRVKLGLDKLNGRELELDAEAFDRRCGTGGEALEPPAAGQKWDL